MADEPEIGAAQVSFGGDGAPPPPAPIRRRQRWGRGILGVVLGLVALLGIGVWVLDSSVGHRFVIQRVANLAPASGLRITVGRIEGSLYGAAVLHDVTLSDPKGVFLTVPVSELDWRPLSWLKRGLDVRSLVMHQGRLLRAPALKPGKPGGSTLPNFDIRVDRLVLDRFVIEPGVVGERRTVDLQGRADVRSGRALVDLGARLGGGDRLAVHLDSEPDRNKFDLAAAYDAPRGGLLAALTGAEQSVSARVGGKGGWTDWNGFAVAHRAGQRFAAFRIGNRSGQFHVAGQAYPQDMLTGTAKAAVGGVVSLVFDGTFADNVVNGRLRAQTPVLHALAQGPLDLGQDRANGVTLAATLDRPGALLPAVQLAGVRLTGRADGPFSSLAVQHRLVVDRLQSGTVQASGLTQQGTAQYGSGRLSLPLAVTVARLATGNPSIDPRLVNGRLDGLVTLVGNKLESNGLAVRFPGLAADLALRSDIAQGTYALAGPVRAQGLTLENLGTVDARADLVFAMGSRRPWTVSARASGAMTRVANATLESLTGGGIRFVGTVSTGAGAPLLFRDTRLTSRRLSLAINGQRLADGRTTINGSGRSLDYGPFTVQAEVGQAGPKAVLVFADPLPAASLKNVRVALAPIKDGFRIETAGGSALGPFAGTLGLFMRTGGPTQVQIEKLRVSDTDVSGALTLGAGGATGKLAVAGGGLNGTIGLSASSAGQAVDAVLIARRARFGGQTATLQIADGRLEAKGLLAKGRSTIDATLYAAGVQSGRLFIGRVAAHTNLVNGAGPFTLSLAGRRGARFALAATGNVAPDRVVVLASGDYAGRPIAMPRRAVLTREAGGWRLAPTQVTFAGGVAIAEGHLLGGPTELHLQLAKMPLSVADIAVADLGLGGTISGIVDYRHDRAGPPTGQVRVLIKGLTRSGLVLTSSPIDVGLVAALDASSLQARAVFSEGTGIRGRLQARIVGLPAAGSLPERLRAGSLAAQLRYAGPAEALWRLAAIDTFDLTGPLGATADVTGDLDNPVIRGAVASTGLRLQSALTGSDLRNIRMTGSFDGSRLALQGFTGTAPNGGTVSGSGTVDLSDIASKGVGFDLRLAAANAALLNRDDIKATVTGPLRLVSDGNGGTIAGRLRMDKGSWALGRATAGASAIPRLKTREINLPFDVAPPAAARRPFRYLIDVSAPQQFDVRGLGLDSEWGADVKLRGTTDAPTLLGEAQLIRGNYQFAGKTFDVSRGRIRFFGESPPDPQLDIAATGDANGVTATIAITGSASKPSIAFTSVPALPEEELLSRLLFGSSITQISAPEALQLAAAVASLRGGGGLDPINKLRSAIGLDRLRVIGADAATGRGTAIAVGKYVGRRFFVELVTDGKGYSASTVEFRITRWLSVLGTISSLRQETGVNVKASKDY